MSLVIPASLILEAQTPELVELNVNNNMGRRGAEGEINVPLHVLTDEVLDELYSLAESSGNKALIKTLRVVKEARTGDADVVVPNIRGFAAILESYLKQNMNRGWIYSKGNDGQMYPELVVSIDYMPEDKKRNDPAQVRMRTVFYGVARDSKFKVAMNSRTHFLIAGNVVHRKVSECLLDIGLYKESKTLDADYEASMDRFYKLVRPEFAEQFLFTGTPFGSSSWGYVKPESAINRKVIHDTDKSEFGTFTPLYHSCLFDDESLENEPMAEVPEHPLISVFDLTTHSEYLVNSDTLTPYTYDKSLKDKIILPEVHKDLLDILTTNLDDFTHDIIEGKSAGNIILCKGIAGVGKTLTAEIYSEIIERPLYSIRSGTLGTRSEKIEENLRQVFGKAKRWNCVLLLDEADVFVCQRGSNIEQNAIVAEFLRTLEYFDGLLFMTTNRPDDIDEAVISRCAAIINYKTPDREDARQIWRVMAKQFDAEISTDVQEKILDMFPGIAPRDIKLVLRLALRMAKKYESELTPDIFRQCAMFRNVKISEVKA